MRFASGLPWAADGPFSRASFKIVHHDAAAVISLHRPPSGWAALQLGCFLSQGAHPAEAMTILGREPRVAAGPFSGQVGPRAGSPHSPSRRDAGLEDVRGIEQPRKLAKKWLNASCPQELEASGFGCSKVGEQAHE